MSIFLGSKKEDMLDWRSVAELVKGLHETISAQRRTLLPGEELELLRKVRERLDADLADEEQSASEFVRLLGELHQAQYEDELPGIHERFTGMAKAYFRKRGSVLALNTLCTTFRDELWRKILHFAEQYTDTDLHGQPPVPYCWLLGRAAGRGEQTFRVDSEFFLIYRENTNNAHSYFEKFSYRVMAALEGCGLMDHSPRTAPLSRFWRGSFTDWNNWLDEDLGREGETRLALLARLADLRPSDHDDDICPNVKGLIREKLRVDPASEVMRQLAKRGVGMPVALGMFGGFRVERGGSHRGCFNVKQSAIDPLVANVRILAIGFGIQATGTVGRIKGLQEQGHLSVDMAERLLMTYHDLSRLGILLEIDHESEGNGMFLNPDEHGEAVRERLLGSMELIVNLQKIVFQTFLEYI
jgi:signal-transduction protein with cAMP-binding, CBS, and nucleotidyltransferase domain